MTDDLKNLITFWTREEQEILARLATFSDTSSNWHYYHGQLVTARLVLSKLQEIRDKGTGV